jgi:hypothetical protein
MKIYSRIIPLFAMATLLLTATMAQPQSPSSTANLEFFAPDVSSYIAEGDGSDQAAQTAVVHPSSDADPKPRISIKPFLTFSDHTVLSGGGSMLVRSKDGVYMSFHSAGLAPGTAVTTWWVFFNQPKKCATSPCGLPDLNNPEAQPSLLIATGRVVEVDGTANFGAFRAVGDTTGAVFGPGLLNAMKAEVHLVVRSHGPALVEDAQMLQAQLNSFNGGCPPNVCGNLQVSIHQP